jgi:hypothetical protein
MQSSELYADLGPSDIRLVEILPSPQFDAPLRLRITTVSLDNQPHYAALSYVWNPHDGTIDTSSLPERVVVVNHKHSQLTVGANLGAAMRQLRLEDTVCTLWIDAICIHQSSDRERNHQVALMGRIYSSAKDVYIWLGPASDRSSIAMTMIAASQSLEHLSQNFMDALELLLSRDWFGRVWVAQELALAARDPMVLCGVDVVYWSRFATTIKKLRVHILHKPTGEVALAVASKALRVSNLARIRETGRHASLADRIQRTLYMQASDPRDRIFALSALTSSLTHQVVADYTKSKEQVAAEVAALLIQEDFVGYMWTRLWEHKHYNTGMTPEYLETTGSWTSYEPPSFSADLEALGRKALRDVCKPPLTDLRLALNVSRGVLPIADFTSDCREMMTLGYDMGHVTFLNARNGKFRTSKDYTGVAPFQDMPRFDIFLVGLFGINAPFLLRRTQDDPTRYKIIAFVNVSDRWTWGHPYFEPTEPGEHHPSHYSSTTQDLRRWEHLKWYASLRSSGEADRFSLYVIT